MALSPLAEHVMLRDLEGRWTGRGELMASPWSAGASIETCWTFRWDPSGLNLIHDYYEKRSDGADFAGHGVMAIDPETLETLWFWFDSYGQPPLWPSRGGWIDGVLTLHKTTPRGANITTFAVGGDQLTCQIWARPSSEPDFRPILRSALDRSTRPA